MPAYPSQIIDKILFEELQFRQHTAVLSQADYYE